MANQPVNNISGQTPIRPIKKIWKIVLIIIVILACITGYLLWSNNKSATNIARDIVGLRPTIDQKTLENSICPQMVAYAKYFTYKNGEFVVDPNYEALIRGQLFKMGRSVYDAAAQKNLSVDYKVNCSQITKDECNLYSDHMNYIINPKLDCNNLRGLFLCKEKKQLIMPAVKSPPSPRYLFEFGNYNFFPVLKVYGNNTIDVVHTICPVHWGV